MGFYEFMFSFDICCGVFGIIMAFMDWIGSWSTILMLETFIFFLRIMQRNGLLM